VVWEAGASNRPRLPDRSGELCQLRWRDIDTSDDVWLFRPPEWKGSRRPKARKRPRIIAIGPRCQRILAKYKTVKPNAFIFSPRVSEEQRLAAAAEARVTPLSCGNRRGTARVAKPMRAPGKVWTSDTYGNAVRAAASKAKKLGLISEPWTPHQLRHAVGDRVRDAFGLDDAAAYLGHRDVETTKIYARLATERAIEVARQIG